MTLQKLLVGAAIAGAVSAIGAALLVPHTAAKAQPAHMKKHLLVVTVTKGFRHDSIPVAEKTIETLGNSTGEWGTDFARTDEEMAEKMTPAGLKRYDALAFANTTGDLPLPNPQAFFDYIKAGHGFAAMHSGSDTLHGANGTVSPYVDMLGGEFLTHHRQCAIMAHMADVRNPALRGVVKLKSHVTIPEMESRDAEKEGSVTDGNVWKVYDEIYLLKNNDPSKVHTLLWLDQYPNDGSPDANMAGLHLISWTKSYGAGRVFYTELGHRKEVWGDPLYQQHITGGIEFALGLARGSTTPGNVLTAEGPK